MAVMNTTGVPAFLLNRFNNLETFGESQWVVLQHCSVEEMNNFMEGIEGSANSLELAPLLRKAC